MVYTATADLNDFVQGDGPLPINLTLVDEDGNAVDITGWEFWLTLKDRASDDDVSADIQTHVTTHSAPASGKTTIELSQNDTDIPAGTYHYDIQWLRPNGEIRTPIVGTVDVIAEITRADS